MTRRPARPKAGGAAGPGAKARTARARTKAAKADAAKSEVAGPPDLDWLVGPASKKLRALLRIPDQSKIHQLLREAEVFGREYPAVVHPDTTRALTAPLVAALDDTAEIVRMNAAWLLGRFGPPEACAALARVTAADASVKVRQRAAEALGALVPPGPAGLPALVAALVHRGDHMDDTELRQTAARALARYGPLDARQAPALLRALELEHPTYEDRGGVYVPVKAPDWLLAELLAPVLAAIGTAALPALRTALTSQYVGVRALGVMALSRVVPQGGQGTANLEPLLEPLVRSKVEAVRTHAAIVLAALGRPGPSTADRR